MKQVSNSTPKNDPDKEIFINANKYLTPQLSKLINVIKIIYSFCFHLLF